MGSEDKEEVLVMKTEEGGISFEDEDFKKKL